MFNKMLFCCLGHTSEPDVLLDQLQQLQLRQHQQRLPQYIQVLYRDSQTNFQERLKSVSWSILFMVYERFDKV